MAEMNGKLIYQLTSASALKDTDLFAISTSDNLTRSISLFQIKTSFKNEFYDKENTDRLLDELRQQIKEINDNAFELNNDITEFRNEFNVKLQELGETLVNMINEVDKDSIDRDTALGIRIDNLNTKVDNNYNTLNTKIDNLERSLTEKIDGLILYGPDIPTTLETGRLYLQYF